VIDAREVRLDVQLEHVAGAFWVPAHEPLEPPHGDMRPSPFYASICVEDERWPPNRGEDHIGDDMVDNPGSGTAAR